MKIQAFIPEWNSPRCQADRLLRTLEPYVERVEILEAYDVPFSEQWAEAVFKFSGDVFVWAMGDSRPLFDMGLMFLQMRQMYLRGDIAMYAPNLDYTAMVYDRSKLIPVATNVYEVPGTDLVFASMSRELLESLPPITGNLHGWAYDYLATWVAYRSKQKVVRDYNFLVDHPYGKAYSEPEAIETQDKWMAGLHKVDQDGIRQIQKWMDQVCLKSIQS